MRGSRKTTAMAMALVVAGLAIVLPARQASAASGDRHASVAAKKAKKGKQGKKKGQHHVPPRLWYRITLRADATAFRPTGGDTNWAETWALHSNTAVRVKLLCTKRLGLDEPPFMVKVKKVKKGKKRRAIAGCHPRANKKFFKPALVFDANAQGEVESFSTTREFPPDGNCQGWTETDTLRIPVDLVGRLTSSDLTKAGLIFSSNVVTPVDPAGVDTYREPIECDPDTLPAVSGTRQFIGSAEHFAWEPIVGDDSVFERLRGRPDVKDFGRRFSIDLGGVFQPFDINRPQSESSGQAILEKDYSYRITFRPCPNRGLDVGNC